MAIAFDAATTSANNVWNFGTGSYSWSHTCTGSNLILFVGVEIFSASALSVSGITYNGVALTKVDRIVAALEGNRQDCELWYLVNPATGSNTIAVSLSGTADFTTAQAASYTGVNQSNPIDTSNTNQNTSASTTFSNTATTTADNCWLVSTVFPRGGLPSASTGTIRRASNTGSLCCFFDSNSVTSPPGSDSLNYTSASGTWPGGVMAVVAPFVIVKKQFLYNQTVNRANTY